MQITVIAAGKLKSRPVQSLVDDYARRLPRALKLNWIEVPSGKGSSEAIMSEEADRIRARVPAESRLAVLSEKGHEMSSLEFARWLGGIRDQGKDLCFVIGGAEGVHHNLLSQSNDIISLSKLTFPHEMVRAILAEQIYRAFSILRGEPYHRE